jgi:diacylglycerol kinase (ATP)
MNVNALVRRMLLATRYSWQGLRAGWRTQAALRYEVCFSLLVLPLGWWLGRSGVERALLIGSWLFVIVVELINSAIETVVDRVGADVHELSGRAKDLGSAAVFCSILLTVVTWLVVCIDLWTQ